MQKIRIRLPATLTDFGPGPHSLGLAIALHTTVEITPRSDNQLLVETEGIGAGEYPLGLQHPVVLGMARFFQHLERAQAGLYIRIDNHIPLASGLGAEVAFQMAGVIAGNNLMNQALSRSQLLHFMADMTGSPPRVAAALLGGLSAAVLHNDTLIHHTLPAAPVRVVIAVPEVERYTPPIPPERIRRDNALRSLQRLPLLVDALRTGDVAALEYSAGDSMMDEDIRNGIPGYPQVAQAAQECGASAIMTSGGGPGLVVFSAANHEKIAQAMRDAFERQRLAAFVTITSIDTQGIVISAMASSR